MKRLLAIFLLVASVPASAATLSLNLTVPDDQVPRIVAAFQADADAFRLAQVPPLSVPATQGQVLNYIKTTVINALKDKVRRHEHDLAHAAVPAPTPIEPQ